ncbi:MAG: hypothetical protein Kow00129_11820 [Thermoleophilia bacterium]
MDAGGFMRIAIGIFFLLAGVGLGYALYRLADVLGQVTTTIHDITEETVPILTRLQTTVDEVNSELAKIDEITGSVVHVTETVESTASAVGSAVGAPVKKLAAWSAGLNESVNTFVKGRRKEE